VGRVLVPKLVDAGGQVRVYVRRDVPEYRSLGVKVAIGDADHEGRLESALEQVHTLVHLVGGPLPERGVTVEWLNLETTDVALRAAENAEVRRVLFLSPLGADPASDHPYLAAKGRAEESVRSAKMEHAIFRCTPILAAGSTFREALEHGALRGSYRLNPVAVNDVCDVLVAADTRDTAVRGTWDLGGSQILSLDALTAGMSGKRSGLSRLRSSTPKELTTLYARDAVADPAEAVRQFGLDLAPFAPE
jgi:NADH dehydrogenase